LADRKSGNKVALHPVPLSQRFLVPHEILQLPVDRLRLPPTFTEF
jgi:hypothetical protein